MNNLKKIQRLDFLEKKLKKVLGFSIHERAKDHIRQQLEQVDFLKRIFKSQKQEEFFSEGNPNFYRQLTQVEKKVNWVKLQETFDQEESNLILGLELILINQLNEILKKIEQKISSNQISSLAKMPLIDTSEIKDQILKTIKSSFEKGKQSASDEIDVKRPPNTSTQTQLLNYDSVLSSQFLANEIDFKVKEEIKSGLDRAQQTAIIISAVSLLYQSETRKLVNNISKTIVGENINKGRGIVFHENTRKVPHWMRTEILDDDTCPVCMSIDGRIIEGKDKMSALGLVHAFCRGVWVAITVDEELPYPVGIPQTVRDRFDLEDGYPKINKFKQFRVKEVVPTITQKRKLKSNKLINDKKNNNLKKYVLPNAQIEDGIPYGGSKNQKFYKNSFVKK